MYCSTYVINAFNVKRKRENFSFLRYLGKQRCRKNFGAIDDKSGIKKQQRIFIGSPVIGLKARPWGTKKKKKNDDIREFRDENPSIRQHQIFLFQKAGSVQKEIIA